MHKAGYAVVGDRMIVTDISLRNKLEMLLFGRSKLAEIALSESWSGRAPFYAFSCSKHGVVANNPRGFAQALVCPVCEDYKYSEALADMLR